MTPPTIRPRMPGPPMPYPPKLDEHVGLEHGVRRNRRPARVIVERLRSQAEGLVPSDRPRPIGIEARYPGRNVRGEEIEAPIVHVSQELGGALDGGLAVRGLDRDPPCLPASGNELVAEGREGQSQLFVVPRDEDAGRFADELMVPEQGNARAESAAQVLRHRDFEKAAVLSGREPTAFPRHPAPERLEEQGLAGETAVKEEARGPSDGDRGGFRDEEKRQADRRLSAGDKKVQALAAGRAEIVLRFVDETISSGLERLNGDRGPAVGAVFRGSAGGLVSLLPEAEDLFRDEGRFPAGPQAVPGGPERRVSGRDGRLGNGLVGGKECRLGFDEADDAPGPLSGFGRSVEVGARDRERIAGIGPAESVRRGDRRFYADEAEPERPCRRPGLASLVRDVDGERIPVGQARAGSAFSLVHARREHHLDGPVLAERDPPAGDDLGASAGRWFPPPPLRIEALALDLPDGRARSDGKPEVIAGLPLQGSRTVQPKGLVRVLDGHFERRPLVLLDPDPGETVGRGSEAPCAEGTAGGGNDELAARRAIAVQGECRFGHPLAVDVLQPYRRAGVGRRPELAEITAAPEGQDLPEELLAGPVNAPVGVDERGARLGGRRRGMEVHIFLIDGQVLSLGGEEEERALPFGPRREMGPALRVRGFGLRPAMTLLPVEGVKVDRGSRDGPARSAGEDDRVQAPFDGGAAEDDQVPDDDVERPDAVRVTSEISAG